MFNEQETLLNIDIINEKLEQDLDATTRIMLQNMLLKLNEIE